MIGQYDRTGEWQTPSAVAPSDAGDPNPRAETPHPAFSRQMPAISKGMSATSRLAAKEGISLPLPVGADCQWEQRRSEISLFNLGVETEKTPNGVNSARRSSSERPWPLPQTLQPARRQAIDSPRQPAEIAFPAPKSGRQNHRPSNGRSRIVVHGGFSVVFASGAAGVRPGRLGGGVVPWRPRFVGNWEPCRFRWASLLSSLWQGG